MVGPNKILTVSYGTFSCTLEGFDDPFSTMRGIAEYFRDLAADDRYFGAEPPTPDAEMLHRIAEKEIQRRVEARVSPTGIVLTQMDDADAGEAKKNSFTDLAEEAEGEDQTAEAAAQTAAASKPAEADEDPFVKMVEPAPSDASHESVAERLARIRAVVQQGSTDYAEDGANAEVVDASADESTNDWFQADEPASEDASGEVADASGADAEVAEEEASFEDLPADAAIEDAFEEDASAELAADDAEEVDEDPETDADDEDADATLAFAEEEDEDVTIDIAALAADFDDEQVEDVEQYDDAAEDDTDVDLSGILGSTDEVAEDADDQDLSVSVVEDEFAAEEADDEEEEGEVVSLSSEPSSFAELIEAEKRAEDVEATDGDDEEDPETVSRLLKMRLSDFAQTTEAHDAFVATQEADEPDQAIEAEYEAADEQEPEAQEPEAPLVLDQAVSGETLVLDADSQVEDADTADAEPEVAEQPDAAEDEGEIEAAAEEEDAVAAGTAAEQPAEASPEAEPQTVKGEATSLSRLLRLTNSEMEQKDTSRRRSAIAHLKAAVAATRADREHTDSASDTEAQPAEDQTEAYREDLARVVRPRRPEEGVRPTSRRLAPLMLVTEQRVDIDAIAGQQGDDAAVDVQPKRVNRSELEEIEEPGNIFSAEGSFQEFAREMGAVELTDLLEAAAAYYHYVEGQEHFSRPQIMKAVEDMGDGPDFSREERLRSFGMLLRRGKIRKIRRGQFEIADSTRFRPELRAGE